MGLLGRRQGQRAKLLELLHRLDALRELVSLFQSPVYLLELPVHLGEVLVDEEVNNLWRQLEPDVENSVLTLALESLEQVLLDIRDNRVRSSEVVLIPFPVALAIRNTLLADGSVGEQVVDELNREHLDLIICLELACGEMATLRNVQEDAVDEEKERFDVKKLAPAQAKVEEKLGQALIADAPPVSSCRPVLLADGSLPSFLLQESLLLVVHEEFVTLIKAILAFV